LTGEAGLNIVQLPRDTALLIDLDSPRILEMRRKGTARKMSDDDLTWAVEASATQIALRWTVHQWELVLDGSSNPLDLQIVHFSTRALGEMCAAYPILEDATEELRWLTYFKGLIAANTHPHDQMLAAIDAVRRRWTHPIARLPTDPGAELANTAPYEVDSTSLADALAAIDRALNTSSYGGGVANP